MKIKPRRRPVYPADEMSASEDVAVDGVEETGNGAHVEDVAPEAAGNGAHDKSGPNGASTDLAKGNGKGGIMLPKRRKRLGPAAAAVAPIVAEPEVEDVPAAPVAPRLPSKRKAKPVVESVVAPAPLPEPPPARAPR